MCFRLFLLFGLLSVFINRHSEADTFSQLDYRKIQNSIAGYLEAINSRDAKKAAEYWSESGEWVRPGRKPVAGRKLIQSELEKSFTQEPVGMSILLEKVSIRAITSAVAIEDGTAVISVPGRPDQKSSYSVVHLKEDGQWRISAVRETVLQQADDDGSIEQLSWLIGDWVDRAEDGSEIRIQCDWTPGKKSLRRTFTSEGEWLATQVILWDAKVGALRSWTFDGTGSFGNGIWKATDGQNWTVESTLQSASGQLLKSRNQYKRIDDSAVEFLSLDRSIDGKPLNSIGPIRVNRSVNWSPSKKFQQEDRGTSSSSEEEENE